MLEESVSPVSLHISSEESAEYAEQDHDKHASAMYTTPSQRLKQNENRLSHTKTRVNTIAKELGLPRRCLVENTDSSNRVDYAHCLGRSQDERTLTRLEFHWGMEKGTLNLDTRYNILFLSPKFHNCFDDGGFLLLPENRFIECYFRKSREEFPTIDDTIYNYKLIALKSMKKVPLFREEISESSPDNDDSGSDSDTCSTPF